MVSKDTRQNLTTRALKKQHLEKGHVTNHDVGTLWTLLVTSTRTSTCPPIASP